MYNHENGFHGTSTNKRKSINSHGMAGFLRQTTVKGEAFKRKSKTFFACPCCAIWDGMMERPAAASMYHVLDWLMLGSHCMSEEYSLSKRISLGLRMIYLTKKTVQSVISYLQFMYAILAFPPLHRANIHDRFGGLRIMAYCYVGLFLITKCG